MGGGGSTNLRCPVTLAGVGVAVGASGIGTSFVTGRASTTGVALLIVTEGEGVVAGGEMVGISAGTIGVAVVEGVDIFGGTSMTGGVAIIGGVAVIIGVTMTGGAAVIVGAALTGVAAVLGGVLTLSKNSSVDIGVPEGQVALSTEVNTTLVSSSIIGTSSTTSSSGNNSL